jgi:general stress protein 26
MAETQAAPTREDIGEKIQKVLKENDAFMLASTGGEYSPWILGAYFASDGFDLYTFIETHGKTMVNLKSNPRVAVSVSKNDATQDFLQGAGSVELLPESDDAKVRELLVKKMPWFKTYTPTIPVRVKMSRYFVTSFASGWMPAKTFEP